MRENCLESYFRYKIIKIESFVNNYYYNLYKELTKIFIFILII